jgi:hypothetical protein
MTCRDGIARGDGVDDGAVLLLHRLHEILAPRFVAARDAHAFAQVLLQKAEQQAELRITGGLADDAVEGQVLGHAVAPLGHRAVDGLERAPQRRDVGACGALGRQRRDRAFEHPPHLDHVHHGLHGTQHGRVEGQRLVLRRGRDEHARALARNHERPGLELVHRLAHHRARDAVRGGQLLLGRQAVAGRELARFDEGAQAQRQAVGQPVGCQPQGFGGEASLRGRGGMEHGDQVIIQIFGG